MKTNQIDDWLNKAFQLAFFIHGKRDIAKQIAVSAMNKLETASNAQFKRYYYTPVGRAETSRATRSRVSLNDLQLLQRLVFVESENFEKQNEATKKTSERNLLVYFIKHLVRISLKRNSFYVTLGISRILHNYGTNDAMEIYNIVVQDADRVHDDYYYRSRKGVLMKELKARFGELLEVVKVNRGEERFNHQTDTEKLSETAKDCLQFFTPWNSSCAIPDKFNPFDDIIAPFHFDKQNPDAEHRIEVNRIHAALHPQCFARLTDALNLPAPKEKMEIPKFMLSNIQPNENNDDWRNPPNLEADELQTIKDLLAAQAESRRALSANLLRVVVDGNERAKINLEETDQVNFDLGDEAELIEVRVVEKDGEVILATHLLSFEDLENGNQLQSVLLEGGQKVSFNLQPTKDEYGEVVGINCGVEYAETELPKPLIVASENVGFSLSNWFNNLSWAFKPALAFGLILLAMSIGWLFYRQMIGANKQDVAHDNPTPKKQTDDIKIPEPSKEIVKDDKETSEKIVSPPKVKEQNDSVIKKDKKPNSEDKKRVAPKKEIVVETPPKELQAQNNKPKNLPNDANPTEVWRLPIREKGNNIDERKEVRSPIKRGKSLGEIKHIYLDISGDESFSRQIKEQISAEIFKNGTFTIVPKEKADARLMIFVRRESDANNPTDETTTAIVRLVNSQGFVVYPTRKRVSGWKYVGAISKLSARIANDLAKTKQTK